MANFDDNYWLAADREGQFPDEFYKAIAADGWLGIAMPEAYGGADLGVAEAAKAKRITQESETNKDFILNIWDNLRRINGIIFTTDLWVHR